MKKLSSNFKPEELVKVSGKSYPVVGGRLRLAHEESKALNIETTVITYDGEKAIIQAKVTTDKGTFNGLGNATTQRDRKLANAILELAETRAIARALRFAGYGVEYTGFEEMPTEHEEPDPKAKATVDALTVKVLEDLIKQRNGDLSKTLKYYHVSKLSELTPEQAGHLKTQLAS